MADDPGKEALSLEEAVAEAPTNLEEVKDAIGADGTIASMRSRIPKMRVDAESGILVEDKPASQEKTAEEKEAEEKAASEAKSKKGEKKEEKEEFKPEYKDHQAAEKAV